MTNPSDLTLKQLLASTLAFLALPPTTQVKLIEDFNDHVAGLNPSYDSQHPLVEVCESLSRVPWSDDAPAEVKERIEELDAIAGMMFSEKSFTERFCSNEALLTEPAWRIVRRLSAELLLRLNEEVIPSLSLWELVCYLAD